MSSPQFITIKLEIQIPSAGGTPSVALVSPERASFSFLTDRDPIRWCPGGTGNDVIPIRPGSGSGSGSNTGTFCGWAVFGDNPPDEVRGQAILKNDVLLGALGSTPNAMTTVSGTPNADHTVWTWNGYLGQPEIPGASYSPTGIDNYFVIWSQRGSEGWHQKAVPFTGVTGTHDPCGAPTSTLCASGSGSGSLTRSHSVSTRIYPALWCVAASGFTVAPLLLFNATWALRQVTDASHPTWNNSADGLSAPSVRLKLCPKNGWELVLKFNGTSVVYLLPFLGNSFGPLLFAERSETLPELGRVELPKILVSAI